MTVVSLRLLEVTLHPLLDHLSLPAMAVRRPGSGSTALGRYVSDRRPSALDFINIRLALFPDSSRVNLRSVTLSSGSSYSL